MSYSDFSLPMLENLVMKNLDLLNKSQNKLKDFKHTYDKNKSVIELSKNSTTQLKKTLLKNIKIENKIETVDSKSDNVISHFQNQISDNQKRRLDRIQAAKDKYEAKLEKEINEINATCDSYHNYCVTQIESKHKLNQIAIRDLSFNIIEPSIGDIIDEDAYPILVKLKCDIKKEEDAMNTLHNEINEINSEISAKQARLEQTFLREQQMEKERIEREEQDKLQKAREESKRQKEYQDKQDEARWERQKQEKIENEKKEQEKQKQKALIKEWNNKFYNQLSDDEKKKFGSLTYSPHKENIRAMDDINSIKKYINDTFPIIQKRYDFEDLIDNKKIIINEKQRDFYYDLDLDNKDKIVALKTKVKQTQEIIRLYNESIEEKEEDDE